MSLFDRPVYKCDRCGRKASDERECLPEGWTEIHARHFSNEFRVHFCPGKKCAAVVAPILAAASKQKDGER